MLLQDPSVEGGRTPEARRGPSSAAPKSFFRPELNSLRFFAFALVFFDHARPVGWIGHFYSAGMYGVPVFFLLSAYLICTLLLREHRTTGTIRVGFFMMRRVLRIWPLYFAVLVGGYALGRVLPDIATPRRMLMYFLLLIGNVFIARNGWTDSPSAALWSLSIEEQFYLVIPFVARLFGNRGLRLVCWTALLVSAIVLVHFGLRQDGNDDVVWVNSFVCFLFFALGGLIASYSVPGFEGKRLLLRASLLLSGLLCFLIASSTSLLNRLHLPPFYSLIYLFIATGTVAIFFAFLNYPAKPRSVTGYLGLISYGLYVFHPWCLEAVVDFLETHAQLVPFARNLVEDLIALTATVLLAALSYHFFELPILRLKRRFEVIPANIA